MKVKIIKLPYGICPGAIDNLVDRAIGNWKLKFIGEKKTIHKKKYFSKFGKQNILK